MKTVIIEYEGSDIVYGQSTFDTNKISNKEIAKEFERSHLGLKVTAVNFKPIPDKRDKIQHGDEQNECRMDQKRIL